MSKKSKKRKQLAEAAKTKAKQIKNPVLPSFWKNKTHLISILAALVITLGCFYNTTQNEFVNWDDDRNFYENEYVSTINKDNFWKQTKKIFTSNVIGNYNPLTIWTFAVEKRVYGFENPGKWHATNIALHLICVFLIFRICILLGLKWQGSLFVALLFGIHPMRVESVAWVTERKDVLFGAFYLSALYFYIKGKLNGKKYYALIFTFFILSLLSKIQAVVLPLSMIAVDYYLDGKLDFKSMIKKGPYFLLSLLFGFIGVYLLKGQGALESAATYPTWQRIFVGSYSYMIYLIKSIVPFRLSPLYPYSPQMPVYYYPTLLLFPAVGYSMFVLYKRNLKVWVFGLFFFTVNIMFLLQILGAGQGFLADRFTYIAYFGLFFIAGYYFDKMMQTKPKLKTILWSGAAVLFLIYGYMTIQQNTVWKNSETLWTHVLKYYQKATLPYGNRANYLRQEGRIQEALKDYDMATSLNPKGEQAFNSRARLYFDIARTRDTLMLALQDYNKAIELDPENGEFLINRGATYARLGDVQRAIADIDQGLIYKPSHAVGYLNRSVLNNGQGKFQEALNDIITYLKLKPYNADLWYEKARALRNLNRLQESIPAYDRSIQLKRNEPVFYYERGRTFKAMGRIDEAKRDIQMAINLGFKNIDPTLRRELGI
ncbi:MAG: tetratricopeptide repeat protein [Saprospiraceae bacterium]|nr:tetratricopeptide repeat protein [Saprospiraceae bacterium]